MRLSPTLAALFLAWLAGSAPASATDRRKACTFRTAETATVAAIHGDFQRWSGRCVRLAGLLAKGRLYADRAALAEPWPIYGGPVPRSIVIYPEGPGRGRRAAAKAEVVGRISSCEFHHAAAESVRAEHPESIVWASGFCHTSMETYIRPSAIRLSGAPVPRLTEAEIPLAARLLVEAPEGTPGLALHVAAARAMAAALVRCDRSEFLRLADPDATLDLAGLNGKPPPRWLRTTLRENAKAFAAAAGRQGLFPGLHPVEARQRRVLTGRGDLAQARKSLLARVITCWCREDDCTGRWPVLAEDADNTERRPYACIRTNPYVVHRKGIFMQADAGREPGPFAEP